MAKKPDVNIKIELNKGDTAALDRFISTYQSGEQGKTLLVKQCLAGGYLLKESGLLDLITAISERDDYQNADSFGRTKLLAAGLRDLFGNNVTLPTMITPPATETHTPKVEPVEVQKPEPEQQVQEEKAPAKATTANNFEGLNISGADSLGQ